jgi:P-type Ca2+ transporter type 2C
MVASAPRPYERPATDVAHALGVDPAVGLSSEDVRRRLSEHGRNEIEPQEPPGLLSMLRDAATEPFVLLLAIAGALAAALGEVRDGLLVLAGLVPIVGADVVTGYRGERALAELRAAGAPAARVRRDGTVSDVPATELVPGDAVLLRVGDVVPADVRVLTSEGLLLDRSILTGESLPEPASTEPDPPDAALVDRRCIAYSGTSVVRGRGTGLVVATGPRSELGRIASALGARPARRSPLQVELDRLVRILLVAGAGLILVTTGLGFVRGRPAGENLLAGISAAIAAIPEEPPVLLAVVLGLGAYRLLRRGVLVRRLNAQETLGAVDLILTDKTGTLTENRLRVSAFLRPNGVVTDRRDQRALTMAALRAEEDAWRITEGVHPGSFTTALLASAEELELTPRLDPAHLIDGEPATEHRPYSRTSSRVDGRTEEIVLGAPEAVLALGAGSLGAESLGAGSPDAGSPDAKRDAWHALVDQQAQSGSRLLLLSWRAEGAEWQPLAVLAFSDPLRPGVDEALRTARDAGIQTVVVTGDHPLTAATVAARIGLSGSSIVTGADLDSWDDRQLRDRLGDLEVVARAVPEQKLRLVDVARAEGRTVAVTGDGVNDAPALQHADVAVAMGSGSAVAREASDLVLGDDSFVTLMGGLAEGRRIVANVQKGLAFLVSTHVALLGFILLATLAGFDQPLLPIQILWLELFIDVSASVAFEREPREPGAMQRPPRPPGRPLLTRGLLLRIAAAGGWTAVAALVLMAARPGGDEHARWLAFDALVFGQAVRAYANRSLDHPVSRLPVNRFLAVTAVAVIIIQLAIPYIPILADAFRATTIGPEELALVAGIALAPAVVAEVVRARGIRPWVA